MQQSGRSPKPTSWAQMSASQQQQQQSEAPPRSTLSSIITSAVTPTCGTSSTSSSGSTPSLNAQAAQPFDTATTGSTATTTSGSVCSMASLVDATATYSPAAAAILLGAASGLDQLQTEDNRELRLQLYVFVLRCISYTFNAKQTNLNDFLQRQQQPKLRKAQLEQIVNLHSRYLNNNNLDTTQSQELSSPHQHLRLSADQVKQLDVVYREAQMTFNKKFLTNERMRMLVECECFTQQDLREMFRQNAERVLKQSRLFVEGQKQAVAAARAGRRGAPSPSALYLVSSAANTAAAAAATTTTTVDGVSGCNNNGDGGSDFALFLANKEALINSWLAGFESIIREDPNEPGSCGGAPGSSNILTSTSSSSAAAAASAVGGSSSLAVDSTAGGATSNSSGQAAAPASISKEHLYQMFQNILNVKKFEHQLLYNALQLDSTDEQAAAVRRELDGRIARIAELERNKKLMPKFVLKEMESLYLEESRMSVNKLMVNLDNLPVMKAGGSGTDSKGGYGLQKFRRYNNSPLISEELSFVCKVDKLKSTYPVSRFFLSNAQRPLWSLTYNGLSRFGKIAAQASLTREGLVESHPVEPQLTKLDLVLAFNIEVIVMEVRGLRHLAPNREIYCTMEIEGSERLQTEHVQAKKPLWDTQGDFTTNHPLPSLKIKLYAVNPSMLSLEDKELGKLVLRPTVLSPKTPEWCTMQPSSSSSSSSSSSNNQSSGCGANSGGSSLLNSTSITGSGGGIGGGGGGNNLGSDSAGGGEELRIRVIVRMNKPQQLKHCGYLYGIGKSAWRKLKRRYHILIQVSQYTFVLCSYRDKKSKPTEMLQLEGYTVDYIEPPTDLIMEHCSEVTSHEHHTSSSSSGLGLAGRLANVILKQPTSSSSGGGGSSSGGGGGGLAANSDPSDSPLTSSGGTGLAGSSSGNHHHHHNHQDQPSAIQTAAALSDELHSKFYFNVVKEGDSVVFACDDEQECFSWVMALYRATGQAHKPTPLRNQCQSASLGSSAHYIEAAFAYNSSAKQPTKLVGSAGGCSSAIGSISSGSSLSISSMLNGAKGVINRSSVDVAEKRARKHGMDEFISADPCKFQHNQLFKYLQHETLRYRLNEIHCSLGWFSAGQVLVLDEYCARYGVRTCFRHLAYLNSLLDWNQQGYFIDHTLLNYGYDFCASHVSGNSGQAHPISSVNFDLRPDGVGTVTVEERDMFLTIKSKLLKMIERQIANFSYCFPFGKPEGALKATLSLLERVFMKEQQTNSMVQNEEVRQLIRKCLEQAALNNYTKLSGQADLLKSMNSSAIYGQQNDSTITNEQVLSGTPTAAANVGGSRLRTASNLSSSSSIVSYASSAPSFASNQQQQQQQTSTSGIGSSSITGSANDSTSRRRQSSNQPLQPLSLSQQQQPQQQQQSAVTMAMIITNEELKAKDKLRYLIRLAELCCEQVEENNEYFSDAFAWHSDLMMDHFELFWSLFTVDMDKVLAELNNSQQQQPIQSAPNVINQRQSPIPSPPPPVQPLPPIPYQVTNSGGTAAATNANDMVSTPSREVFLLFQVLNSHMRKSPNLQCRKFKTHLCDVFKPKLLRYIDVMETTLTRMLYRACEKDSQVNCTMIEQMFVKLDELQRFVLQQLCWPNEHLAEQLHQRLKLMAYELCDACVQRILLSFVLYTRKSNKWTTTTSYTCPADMMQMINLVLETRNRSLKLCTFNNFDQMSYHSKIDKVVESALCDMQPELMAKMMAVLESTLSKLARYDEGNLLAPILSLTYKQGMSSSGRDIGKQYVTFVSSCCDSMRQKINDELWIVRQLEEWYAEQMNVICSWLGDRIDRSLHDVQLVALSTIMPKVYADMSLQGVCEEKLNLKSYQTIMSRLKMEEASATSGSLFDQPNTSIFTSSILSSLTSSSSSSGQGGTSSLNAAASTAANMISSSGGAAGGAGGQSTPIRQPVFQQQQTQLQLQQQQNQQKVDSPSIQSRRFQSLSSYNSGDAAGVGSADGQQQSVEGDNIADRALQGATRMFKGFWTG